MLKFLAIAVLLCIGFFASSDAACTYKAVRLFNGIGASSSGIVQVCNSSGLWSDVCDYRWRYSTHTTILCTQLGYNNPTPITTFNKGRSPSGKFSFMSSSSSGYCSSTQIGNCLTTSSYYLQYTYYCNTARDTIHIDCNPDTSGCTQNQARLYNSSGDSGEGMLQICDSSGNWTAVCDYGFNCNHAIIACRQLGYSNIKPIYRHNGGSWTEFGYGPYRSCSSSYSNLFCCSSYSSYRSSSSYCNPTRDTVYLKCNITLSNETCSPDYAVRLTGGNSTSEGRLEVCYSGQWRSFCGGNFNHRFASIACNQLGFTSNNFVTVITDGRYGLPSTSEYLSGYCYSSYSHIASCYIYQWYLSSSSCLTECTSYGTGVKCYGSKSDGCNEGDVRLVNGTFEREGRLEVCANGVWGTVCSYSFSRSSAYVACKQLGYTDSDDATINIIGKYGTGDGPIVYSYVDCFGSESKLSDCNKMVNPSFDCSYPYVVGLTCLEICNEGDIRLVGGDDAELEGTVEVCVEKRWKLVDDSGWDENDARVVCRQLHHRGGEVIVNSFDQPKREFVYSNVNCRGTEAQLGDCRHIRLSSSTVRKAAEVRCLPGRNIDASGNIVTPIVCNSTEFAMKGCSQICSERTENCVGSRLTELGQCTCTSCTESRARPSTDLSITLSDAKHYRCDAYCKRMMKCFDGTCDQSRHVCVCRYCPSTSD